MIRISYINEDNESVLYDGDYLEIREKTYKIIGCCRYGTSYTGYKHYLVIMIADKPVAVLCPKIVYLHHKETYLE